MKSVLIQLMALPMLMGGVVSAGEKEPVPVYAEVEETEETKVYEHYKDENNYATLVLRENGICTLSLKESGIEDSITCFYTLNENVCVVTYEGEHINLLLDSSNMSFSYIPKQDLECDEVPPTHEEKNIVDKVEDAYNTYIAPLLAGVGITSILSAVVSIAFAVKNRKDKKNIKDNSTTTTKNANTIIEKAEELYKVCNSLKEMCEKDHTLSKEVIDVFNEKAKLITNDISSLQKDVSNLFEIKAYVLNMAQIMSTMASHIPELRESGCAEEIEKIVNKIK